MTDLSRRGLITGRISFVADPAIVRASSLMPVKPVPLQRLQTFDRNRIIRCRLDLKKIVNANWILALETDAHMRDVPLRVWEV